MNMSKEVSYNNINYKLTYAKLSDYTEVKNFTNGDELYILNIEDGNLQLKSAVVDKEKLNLLSENPSLFDMLTKYEPNESLVYLVNDLFIHNLTRYGLTIPDWLRGLDNVEMYRGNIQYKDKAINILKEASNPDFKFVQFVTNPNKKVFKDAEGKLYCEPFILNDSYAELDDANYFLDEFAEHLSHRDDCSFIVYTRDENNYIKAKLLHTPLLGNEEHIGSIISDIEHHLEENDSIPTEQEEIMLVYYPKEKEIEKVVFWDNEIDGRKPENKKRQMYFVQRFIIQDILGGKEFCKVIPEEIEVPKRKFKN